MTPTLSPKTTDAMAATLMEGGPIVAIIETVAGMITHKMFL